MTPSASDDEERSLGETVGRAIDAVRSGDGSF